MICLVLPTNSWHSNGYKLGPSSSRHLSIIIGSGIHTISALGRKKSRFNFTYRDIGNVGCINLPDFANYRSKDPIKSVTSASYLDLLLSIRRDGHLHTSIYQWVDFEIINFLFLSSNISSSQAYGVLSYNFYDALLMKGYFWGSVNFQVSYTNRNTSWNAWKRHSGSFMVDSGILLSNMKSPSHDS